jgi:hypothetical protein
VSEFDGETWLVEERGFAVIERKAEVGYEQLTDAEKLIVELWTVDYSVRNSGTLLESEEMRPGGRAQALELAGSEGLPRTIELFALSDRAFVDQYYQRFEGVTLELAAHFCDLT